MSEHTIGDRVVYRLHDSTRERAGIITGIVPPHGTSVYDQAGCTLYLVKVEGRDWTDRMYSRELSAAPLDSPEPWKPTADCPF
jgi:hypothetical protein